MPTCALHSAIDVSDRSLQEYDADGLPITAAASLEAARKADRLLEKEAKLIEEELERQRQLDFEEQQQREQEFQQVRTLGMLEVMPALVARAQLF